MTDQPQPPTEDDLPEELSFVDLPSESASRNGSASRGQSGIIIAALLGSVTAIGLFFAAKPYLVSNAPPEPPVKWEFNTADQSPANVKPANQPEQTALHPRPPRESGESRTPPAEADNVQSTVADPTNEPFPGLTTKPNPVDPLTSNAPIGTVPERPSDPARAPVVRRPRPSQDAIAETNRDIDAVFLPQIRSAKTPEDKMLLVNVLKRAAQAEPEGSPAHFVLLERAFELAVDAPDANLTNELVATITAQFDVPSFDYQLQAVDTWDGMRMPDMDAAAEQEFHRLLARKAAILGDLAYERKDFKTAATMYAIAGKRRDRADDKDVADLFGKKRTAARTKEIRHTLATSLLSELESTPDDAAKSLEAGIACLQTGLWDDGLDCLVKGSDETLKRFAQEQLKLRASPETRLQAGDHSWDSVRELDRRHAIWLKELAVADYESAFMGLTPLQVQKVKSRVEQVGPVSCVLPEEILQFAFETDDFPTIVGDLIVRNRKGYYGNGQIYGKKMLTVGVRGTAVELNGKDGMVVCPQTENLLPGDSPFTLSIWINTNQSQSAMIAGRMYRFKPEGAPDFRLQMLNDGHCRAVLAPEHGDIISVQSAEPIPHGQWVHLAVTWDLDALTFYVDGRKSASLSVSVPYPQRILANRHWIAIGGEGPPKSRSVRFGGKIDEFRVYDQALSPLQIFHVYLDDQISRE